MKTYNIYTSTTQQPLALENGGGWVYHFTFIRSHSLLWRHIFLLTVGVYSSNYRALYTIGISMTRFKKSVGLSVCNANKKYLLLLHN